MNSPQVVTKDMVVFIDCDETLCCWCLPEDYEGAIAIVDPHDGQNNWVRPHLPHIKVLKNKKSRGYHVVVWSAGGYQWAECVVNALGLREYVDQIMSKPSCYVDDLTANEFMGERIYLKPDSNYR